MEHRELLELRWRRVGRWRKADARIAKTVKDGERREMVRSRSEGDVMMLMEDE